jgi:hypothetical protein
MYSVEELSCHRCGKRPTACTPKKREEGSEQDFYRSCLSYDREVNISLAKLPFFSNYSTLPDNWIAAHDFVISRWRYNDTENIEKCDKIEDSGISVHATSMIAMGLDKEGMCGIEPLPSSE